jgi:short-subunit dehydrogenase
MKRNLAGQRMVITGASSGIGRCLAEQLAHVGAHVALVARSRDKIEELARKLNAQSQVALAVPCDITSDSARHELFGTLKNHWGGLDVLINNAGVASFGHFADSSEAILRQVMEVNFFAPAELIRLAIPFLTNGQRPAIVNVASMCGRRGLPAWPEYSASKFALCGLTEALRGEMARFDIDVLLVVPGLTRSDLPGHLLRNEGRMKIRFEGGMAPDFVARRIVQALERNATETILGTEARWMLRTQKFLPGLVDRLLKRRVQKLYEQP